MEPIKIRLDDKPNLQKALAENPKLAKEVIGTFVALAEEAFSEEKGIRWADLPQELHRDLTFTALIRGILRGALDVREINPDAFDALKVEVHPLAMFSPRKNYVDGGMKFYNWRNHFRLPDDVPVDEDTISSVLRKMLRYARYIKFDQLQHALEYNQIATYRGLGDEQIAKLPMYPALRYQRHMFGELSVGKFFDEIGALDCGDVSGDSRICTACQSPELHDVGKYRICLSCNAGYITELTV